MRAQWITGVDRFPGDAITQPGTRTPYHIAAVVMYCFTRPYSLQIQAQSQQMNAFTPVSSVPSNHGISCCTDSSLRSTYAHSSPPISASLSYLWDLMSLAKTPPNTPSPCSCSAILSPHSFEYKQTLCLSIFSPHTVADLPWLYLCSNPCLL